MNAMIEQVYPLFQYYQALRPQMLELLQDEDLSFQLPGCPTLGQLCVEIGEVQAAYCESFKTFRLDFSYRAADPQLAESVTRLQTWYAALDQDLRQAVEALTEVDLQERQIDRGDNFRVSPRVQLEIYKEALLIFYGKAWVYLQALGKALPPQWQHWIGTA
jgi:uncharacterized damage-inducible protein DinB